jgi:hypothetical protein
MNFVNFSLIWMKDPRIDLLISRLKLSVSPLLERPSPSLPNMISPFSLSSVFRSSGPRRLIAATALLALSGLASTAVHAAETVRISQKDLHNKIHGFWIGQIVGNYVGFPFENLYTDEPLPVLIDRYYDYRDAGSGLRMNLDDRRAYIHIMADAMGGAWSDDDTDVELVTLHAVEKHGLELNYEQMTQMWRAHINRFIWSASRIARDLMEAGQRPPATGSRALNPHWYSLSAQLKTEIWGVFYAGMPTPAALRAQWDASIQHDAWAVHPSIVYASMFSEAFFEKDPEKLVQAALKRIPTDSPYARGIRDVLAWHQEHSDWRTVRGLLHEKYFHEIDGFRPPAPVLGSMINGLTGIMAFLYGEGDFTRTIAIATTAGYDCDNQAATLGGLLGVMHGADSIPSRFTLNLPSRGRWTVPFNDTYINYSRDNLPNRFSISDLVNRIGAITEKAVLAQGGRRLEENGQVFYEIPTQTTITLPDAVVSVAPVNATENKTTGPLIDR